MVKNEVVKIISDMDDNVTFEDIMYQLFVFEKHNKSMRDIREGRVHTTQNVRDSLGVRNA
ncbi:MAG: hypothetical protein FWF77_03155 [Defluviitaleaceae bacterium]|nr:hypothetical protein [Defluviitaleaceae bacterium]